jgi:hypothetical protein
MVIGIVWRAVLFTLINFWAACKWETSWLAGELLAFEEGLCSVELVKCTEHGGWVGVTPALYSRGPGFKFQPNAGYNDLHDFLQSLQGDFSLVLHISRYHWPRGLRCGSMAVRLVGLWVRIPPEAWMSVCLWVLLGTGLCVGLMTRSG